MQASPDERRKSLRVPVYMDVHCELASGTDLECKGVDLGTGGICLKSDTPIDVEEKVSLKLSLPDTLDSIQIEGEVVWSVPQREGNEPGSRSHAAGIKFNPLSELYKNLIYNYILGIVVCNENLLKIHDIVQVMQHIRVLPPIDRLKYYNFLVKKGTVAR